MSLREHLVGRLKAIPREVYQKAEQLTIQGAAEISHALYSQSNAYVPYGAGQQPLDVQQTGVHGPRDAAPQQPQQAADRQADQQHQTAQGRETPYVREEGTAKQDKDRGMEMER